MNKIPFEEMQALAERHNLSHVILFAFGDDDTSHVVTWGKSTEESDQAEKFGHALMDVLKWPESLKQTSAKVKKLIAWILRSHLQGGLTEGMAAELLAVGRVELRQMMIDRYGNDWRDAHDDEELQKRKLLAAGDLDETLRYMFENGIGVDEMGMTYPLDPETCTHKYAGWDEQKDSLVCSFCGAEIPVENLSE